MEQRGSFTISGFAEAARSYFNKDLQSVSLPEAALLAGLIQHPNYLSPYRHPERALERRNLVLDSMVETRAISRPDAEKQTIYECGEPTVGSAWIQFDLRYYVVALLFVVFDVETIFLFPWAVRFKALGTFGLMEMLIFLIILVVGYIWVWKKGALEWV